MKVLYESKTPHFFQIIVAKTLQLGKLEVPKKFVREYGKSLSSGSVVLLKVPSGDTWTVGVEKPPHKSSSSLILFGDGWKYFMEHYSLDVGSLVVFRHEGGSVFMVSIFDISSTEIDYPFKQFIIPGHVEEESPVQAEGHYSESESLNNTEDLSGEPLDGFGSNSSNTIIISDDNDDDDDDFSAAETETPPNIIGRTKSKKKSKRPRVQENNKTLPRSKMMKGAAKRPYRTYTCRKRATIRTGESGRPCFLLQIHPSYLTPKSRVTLPHKFVEQNNLKMKKLKVRIRLSGSRRKWRMGTFYRLKERRGEFSNGGWHKFARNARLRVGDVCEFELTSRMPNTLFFTMTIISRGPDRNEFKF